MNLTVFLAFLVGFVAANSHRKYAGHNAVVPETKRIAKARDGRSLDPYLFQPRVSRRVPGHIQALKGIPKRIPFKRRHILIHL
jgi:hypothetical protein